MGGSAGRKPSTCPVCGERYVRTNFMIRRGRVSGTGAAVDTHILGCARRSPSWSVAEGHDTRENPYGRRFGGVNYEVRRTGGVVGG